VVQVAPPAPHQGRKAVNVLKAEDAGQAAEAGAQAEVLLDRAFRQLRESVEGRLEDGFGSLFPHGLGEIEIRVDIRLSEFQSASLDLRVKGAEAPAPEALDYDEFDDPLLYADDDEL